jgi:hypothetical protein
VPLLPLFQLYPCEGLKQEPIKLRNVKARGVDECMMLTSDAAYLTLIGNRNVKCFGELVINTVSACTGINKRTNLLSR